MYTYISLYIYIKHKTQRVSCFHKVHKVDDVSRFVCAAHRSSLARLGKGELNERAQQSNKLKSLFFLILPKSDTLKLL